MTGTASPLGQASPHFESLKRESLGTYSPPCGDPPRYAFEVELRSAAGVDTYLEAAVSAAAQWKGFLRRSTPDLLQPASSRRGCRRGDPAMWIAGIDTNDAVRR